MNTSSLSRFWLIAGFILLIIGLFAPPKIADTFVINALTSFPGKNVDVPPLSTDPSRGVLAKIICSIAGIVILAIQGATYLQYRRAGNLAASAETADKSTAVRLLNEALRIDPDNEYAIQAKGKNFSRKYRVKEFNPVMDWQTLPEKDIIPQIVEKTMTSQRIVYASIPGKGQVFYNGSFLETTLPHTTPLPVEFINIAEAKGFTEYDEKTEEELLGYAEGPWKKVVAIGTTVDDLDDVVLKTEQNNMVRVDRVYFDYLFGRYNRIRIIDETRPILFYKASFVHGHLWPKANL